MTPSHAIPSERKPMGVGDVKREVDAVHRISLAQLKSSNATHYALGKEDGAIISWPDRMFLIGYGVIGLAVIEAVAAVIWWVTR